MSRPPVKSLVKIRWMLIAAILLSLVAPWCHLSGEPASGWSVLVSGFVSPLSETGHALVCRLAIVVIAANLALATFLTIKPTLAAPIEYCLLLLLDLVILSVWALVPHPTRLWGVWLTALCVAAAIVWELIARATERLQRIGAPANSSRRDFSTVPEVCFRDGQTSKGG